VPWKCSLLPPTIIWTLPKPADQLMWWHWAHFSTTQLEG
jgi:hypothetical protein